MEPLRFGLHFLDADDQRRRIEARQLKATGEWNLVCLAVNLKRFRVIQAAI